MQQYPSLSKQNSEVDKNPSLVLEMEKLRAELWLERSLNKLQNYLNDYLLSVLVTKEELSVIEPGIYRSIYQTLVNELNNSLPGVTVVIASVQAKTKFCKISYLSPSKLITSQALNSQSPPLAINLKSGKQLQIKSNEVIDIEDLQYLETQEPPAAWAIEDDFGNVWGWLIISYTPLNSATDSLTSVQVEIQSQLIKRAARLCAVALMKLKNIESLQKVSRSLSEFNQELERNNQLKNQFLANTSHEIRTPLSSIIGFTHLLLAQGYNPSSERHKEYLSIIQSSGKHLLALINDILDLSKIEANQLEIQWEEVNVSLLCRNVLALVKEKAANKGLQLRLELEPEEIVIVADPLRLKQMLLNLIFNALKFTTSGSVGLQVKVKGKLVHFTVWDTGAGIPEEYQAELFQPYCQIPNSRVSGEEGTGLGLALTRKLAEIHGGSVKVVSEIDRGSSFTVILPRSQMSEFEETEVGTDRKESISGDRSYQSGLRLSYSSDILLVEDDLHNAKLIDAYLSKLGYQVICAYNSMQMWEALKCSEPAVILMDIYLPDVNGLDLVRQLRQDKNYRNIPIIAETAMAMKGDRETCLAAGVDEYISKPIDLPVLGNLVSKYCQLSKKRI
ncbi:hybrid histidine kinase/response regulator HrmK [Mastigocoleus testarum]|uniref:histidine kinase n=1 Tax=Mastigocoleus testarum BC008 TaxID=371196 RepID=A0A0V7ZCB3_9CYAN|nr:hybrid histidine kinase/response regulator HrmK [Mastigocoleus testarum]KST62123.1 two-component system sensor histidine kinase/response regulator [Mastigocoleus testarum BC008]